MMKETNYNWLFGISNSETQQTIFNGAHLVYTILAYWLKFKNHRPNSMICFPLSDKSQRRCAICEVHAPRAVAGCGLSGQPYFLTKKENTWILHVFNRFYKVFTRFCFDLQSFLRFLWSFLWSNLGMYSFVLQGFGIPSFFRCSYDFYRFCTGM